MSVIVKQDDVNQLIYRYLLESGNPRLLPPLSYQGFKHTAFLFYTEADLSKHEDSIEALSPRCLIQYLEKGLLYTSLETHVDKVPTSSLNFP